MSMGERINVFVLLDDGNEMQVPLQQVFPANTEGLIRSTQDLTGLTYMEVSYCHQSIASLPCCHFLYPYCIGVLKIHIAFPTTGRNRTYCGA